MDLSVPTGNADPRGPRTELLDPNERRRQKDRERYASPREKKKELNRKRRERRMEYKGQVLDNIYSTCGRYRLFEGMKYNFICSASHSFWCYNVGTFQGNRTNASCENKNTIIDPANNLGVFL
jgi:hypothetical protein